MNDLTKQDFVKWEDDFLGKAFTDFPIDNGTTHMNVDNILNEKTSQTIRGSM